MLPCLRCSAKLRLKVCNGTCFGEVRASSGKTRRQQKMRKASFIIVMDMCSRLRCSITRTTPTTVFADAFPRRAVEHGNDWRVSKVIRAPGAPANSLSVSRSRWMLAAVV
eukprot:scaffold2117_cov241-Pinguiococcus_pyrenoidosus.AAC.8